MNILFSSENSADSATLTESSEHPSFPAENVLHRWFKKPWRSKYDDGSGWGFFKIGSTNNTLKFLESGGEKVTDGGMEAWTTPTNLTNWVENLTGTSTINQEVGEMHSGTSCARFDIDGSNSQAYLTQNITLVAGALYRLTVWYNNSAGKTSYVQIRDSASNVWLKNDATWVAVNTYITLPTTGGAWVKYELYFSAHASYTGYRLALSRLSAASSSIYFDDVSVQAVLTATLTSGNYDADTLAAEVETQMDSVGTDYDVTYNESTNKFIIAAVLPGPSFTLLLSQTTNSAWGTLGWTSTTDTAEDSSFTATYRRIHTEEELRFNFGRYNYFQFVLIKNHNLQSTAEIQIRYYSDAYITLQATDILTWDSGDIAAVLNRNYRYCILWISDPSNPDGYVEIGRVWFGETFRPTIGYAMERSNSPQDPSVISESENGQIATIQRTKYKMWNYIFEGVKPLEKPYYDDVFENVGFSKPLVICEKPDEASIAPYTFYITITAWEWEHIAGEWWKLSIEVKEER